MSNKKICPIMSYAHKDFDKDTPVTVFCQREKCALWQSAYTQFDSAKGYTTQIQEEGCKLGRIT